MIRQGNIGAVVALACAAGLSARAQTPPPPPLPPPPDNGTYGQIQTPDRSGTANLTNAVEAPLHDLNIMREGIPPILSSAVDDPYARPTPLSCEVLIQDIEALDFALGADFNEPGTPQSPSLTRNNGHIALALVQSGARLLLPYSGLFSTITGARRHDQQIVETITAGSVRRGYLKGLGEAHHCPPPAVPVHPVGPPDDRDQRAYGPQYPIH
jgi:hypothetical protein